MKSFQWAWLALHNMVRWSQFDLDAYNSRQKKEPFPAPAGVRAIREKQLHEEILEVCRTRGYFTVHSRMDKPTTTALGTPDFVVALPDGKTLWVEGKTGVNKLTPSQQQRMAMLRRLGHNTAVVRSL